MVNEEKKSCFVREQREAASLKHSFGFAFERLST